MNKGYITKKMKKYVLGCQDCTKKENDMSKELEKAIGADMQTVRVRMVQGNTGGTD